MSRFYDENLKEDLEMLITKYGADLVDALWKLDNADPADEAYDRIVHRVEVMQRCYNDYVRQYTEIYYPKKEISVDITRILCTVATVVAAVGQSLAIYKWQRDGYLVRNDSIKVQMPRV